MLVHCFSLFERGLWVNDVVVDAKVWHWVVDFVTKVFVLVEVLGAAGGVADWIGLEHHLVGELNILFVKFLIVVVVIFAKLNSKIVLWREIPNTMNALLVLQVLHSCGNITIQRPAIIIQNWILLPLSFLPLPLMTKWFLSPFKTAIILVNLMITAKAWYWIIDLVAELLLFVFVLGAAGRVANWIWFQVNISIGL